MSAGAEVASSGSPRATARTAGFFYLLVFVLAVPFFASSRLVVATDAAATAANILSHETLFRVGWAANLLSTAAYIVVTALFYGIFAPVDRRISRTAAFFSLVGCGLGGVCATFQIAVLGVLRPGPFPIERSREMTILLLRLYSDAYNVALVFFGFYCVLIGALVLRSAFLPRVLGVLMVIAGIGWLTFLWPPLSRALYPWILMPGMIGEGALTLWLVAFGVNADRWREQAAGR